MKIFIIAGALILAGCATPSTVVVAPKVGHGKGHHKVQTHRHCHKHKCHVHKHGPRHH